MRRGQRAPPCHGHLESILQPRTPPTKTKQELKRVQNKSVQNRRGCNKNTFYSKRRRVQNRPQVSTMRAPPPKMVVLLMSQRKGGYTQHATHKCRQSPRVDRWLTSLMGVPPFLKVRPEQTSRAWYLRYQMPPVLKHSDPQHGDAECAGVV